MHRAGRPGKLFAPVQSGGGGLSTAAGGEIGEIDEQHERLIDALTLPDEYALDQRYWVIEVFRQFPHLMSQYPGGPLSMPGDELGVYIAHIRVREQIEDRRTQEQLRRVLHAKLV